jgi:hypothetical protein
MKEVLSDLRKYVLEVSEWKLDYGEASPDGGGGNGGDGSDKNTRTRHSELLIIS